MINKVHTHRSTFDMSIDHGCNYDGGGTIQGDTNRLGNPYAVGHKKGKLKYYGYGAVEGRCTTKGYGN